MTTVSIYCYYYIDWLTDIRPLPRFAEEDVGEPRDGASHLFVWQLFPEALDINGGVG